LELEQFTMYEFTPYGLKTLMFGQSGTKYNERFVVKKMDYTDKSQDYIANMKADNGLYQNELVTLLGHVVYSRSNGFVFTTEKLTYNKKSSVAISNVGYTAYIGDNIVEGSYIKYNNILNKIYSKNIDATYQLQESK